jgi:hypothetical protein
MNSVNYNGLKAKHPSKITGSSHGNVRKYQHHYEQLQKFLDAYDTKRASVQFRQNVLRNQKKHNYQLEYERIRSDFESKLIPNITKHQIINRMAELELMGAKAVDEIQDTTPLSVSMHKKGRR